VFAQSLQKTPDQERPEALSRADGQKADPRYVSGRLTGYLATRQQAEPDSDHGALQQFPTTMAAHSTRRSRTVRHHTSSYA